MNLQNDQNPKRQLAYEYVCQTDQHIYLTGKAGTGKTTFLHKLKAHSPKRLVVTAPTGVAAINAHGETLHSFFQLPFGPYIPGSEAQQRRFRREKIDIIRSLELLIIDEISMVRADVLDAIDNVLRRTRKNDIPFGGLQLLMIGDVHQLPPVVQRDEEHLLREHYQSFYFFGSHALQKASFVSIELDHIYRQSDPVFINLLNRVRYNQLDETSLAHLNQRYTPVISNDDGKLPITLSSHNRIADTINQQQLDALSTPEYTFSASIEDNYPEQLFPQPSTLHLKVGAQVMFTRNDSSSEKRFYNGKIGQVIGFDDNSIHVKCPDDDSLIYVRQSVWENTKYTIQETDKSIESTVVGTFTQYPLSLAWAITIHKSQGLTFEHVIIDASAAFAHGQVYVALSRCKSLQGIRLRSPLSASAIKTDPQVVDFTNYVKQHLPTQAQLNAAKIQFQQKSLLECFDFSTLSRACNTLLSLCEKHHSSIQISSQTPLTEFYPALDNQLINVGEKFKRELQSHFSNEQAPQDNPRIHERSQKAHEYFSEKFSLLLFPWLEHFSWQTDNKAIDKSMQQAIDTFEKFACQKRAGIQSCQQGFSIESYCRALAVNEIDNKPSQEKKDNTSIEFHDLEHPKLYRRLKHWRDDTADAQEVSRFVVMHQRVLLLCAQHIPLTKSSLKNVPGVGKKTIEKYGDMILAITNTYCQSEGIDPSTLSNVNGKEKKTTSIQKEKTPKKITKPKKEDTKTISYELFRDGKSIEEIAQDRGFVCSTIETHLAHFIKLGELNITEVVDEKLIPTIENALNQYGEDGFKAVKEKLGDDISYGQIKLVAAALDKKQPQDL